MYLPICPHANGEGCWCCPSITHVLKILYGHRKLALPSREPVCVLYIPLWFLFQPKPHSSAHR